MKKLFLLLSLCCISLATWADEYIDENGVKWEYHLNGYWDNVNQAQINGAVITRCSNYGTEIVVPESIQADEESHNVVSLDGYVFNDGREQQGSVTSVTLPSTLKRIGWNVFISFSSLKSLNIPEGVTSIGGEVFLYSHDLVLTLPTSLQSVESGAFRGCKTISLPSTNPTSLGNNISSECVFDEVSYIAVPDDAIESYKSSLIWTRYAEKICGHSEIVEYTHTDDNGITWTYCYVLSNSSVRIVKAEGYSTDIDAPATLPWKEQQLPVKAIECSFVGDENIVSVDLSKTSITVTPSFADCSSLTSVLLPATLKEVSSSSFNRCNNLQTINISSAIALEKIGDYAFQNCERLQSVDLSTTKVKEIGLRAFCYCNKLNSIQFPSTLETIGSSAFSSCNSLNSIDLSATAMTELGSGAFSSCGLSSVILPATLKKIGNSAFAYNSSLTINLSEVEEFGEGAFSGIDFSTVDLSSAKVIGSNAFTNSSTTFTINSTTPATIKSNSFHEDAKFVVSPEAYDTFCAAAIWSNWKDNISMYTIDGNNIKWIYRYLADSNSLCITAASGYGTEVTVPNTLLYNETDVAVTQLENVFRDANITSVVLPATLTHIGNYAFAYSNLTTINIPASVTTIGECAFNDCDNLRSIDLSATKVKEIKERTFVGCDNLSTIAFPATLETIGYSAFEHCRKIKSIDLSNTKLTTIGEQAFMCCNELNPLSLPATLKKIGDYAFYDNYALRDLDLSMVEEIGNNAFQHVSLGTADISSAKNIGSEAFNQDITFIINATTPATIKANSFSENSKFIVSSNGYDAFCSANIWKNWADNISMYTIGSDNIKWMYRYLADSNGLCITAASGYGTEVTVPSALPYNGNNVAVTQIEGHWVEYLGMAGIFNDAEITSVVLPATLIHIGDYAFAAGDGLSTPQFASIEIPASVKSIGEGAFQYCSHLNSIDLSKVEAIGDYAFRGCNLRSIDLSSATSIGRNAFTGETFFSIDNAVPATIESEAFSTSATFLVPGSAVADYKTANVWSDYASRIFASNIAKQTINVTAESNTSAVLTAIGGSANQTSVIDLKVIGTINSYDIVVLHDKMIELRYLDLSEARIVANPYCYYENYCTEDDVLGPNSFREKSRLISIKLPAEIKSIGHSAFDQCSKLSEVVMPNSVTRIEDNAFANCNSLQFITLPNKLEYIGNCAFAWGGLKEISFPTTLTRIEWGAFQSSQLETVRIPSSLQYIGSSAFQWCPNLKKVYTYTIEPTDINEETFSNFETAMLYVPVASGQNYYWDEGWKRFLNVAEFDEEYEYFYLNGDHTLDESTGAVDGTPDADLNAGSGLTVEDGVNQNMGDLNIQHDGTNGGSIIAGSEDGNIHADNLHVNINVESGRWYFFCFPFDLKKENISMGKEGTQYIFRWYDGKERAKGNSGWKNVTEEEGSYLKAAVGYIFQCSQSDVLTISLKDVKFKKENKYNELVASAADNLQDASWNFVGNPYLSYYDMNSVGYDAPITVWNGHTYEAIKPGDDDYHFAPFEAFFVQKPDEDTKAMEFNADAQTTLKGSQEQDQVSGARSITRAINPNRRLVNIVLSNGQESDRTRIVFNNNVSMEYELDCDAAKFDAAGVPQLYTLDSRAVKYAINERPVAEGFVTLGYSVPAEGSYTLEAPRMDTPVYVKDNLTRIIHDFSKGNYEFYSETGTFEGRFTILTESRATGIDKVGVGEEDEKIYNLNGQRVNEATGKGIYIKNNRKEVNM